MPDGRAIGSATAEPGSQKGRPSSGSGVRITLVGLMFEITAALQRTLLPAIERDLGQSGLAFQVLVRLARSPGERLRMTDLAEQTGLTPGGLTRTIDRLVEAGLVARAACAGDRRVVYAELTNPGHDQCEQLLDRHEREIAQILDGVFNASDAELFLVMLERLRDRVHPGATKITDIVTAGR